MPKSDRSKVAEAISQHLANTEGRWRGWGTITIGRAAINALEDAGYRVIKMAPRVPGIDSPRGVE